MMQKLGIQALRPGPSGNPDDPNAANSDESKVSTGIELPALLRLRNGQKVTTQSQWQERRPGDRGRFRSGGIRQIT